MRELDAWVKIRISTPQALAWKAEAKQLGESVSSLVRAAILGRAIKRVPEINQQAWIQLAAAAANLNQLAYNLNAAHQEGLDALLAVARDDATAILEILAQFRSSLLGAALPPVEGRE